MREDLKDAYKTLSDYDRHYSTIRATLAIFLFSLSYGIASFLLKDAKGALGNPHIVFIASIIPILFLVTAFILSCYFQRLTYVCSLYMKGIEKQGESPPGSNGGTIAISIPTSSITVSGSLQNTGSGAYTLAGTLSVPPNTIGTFAATPAAKPNVDEVDLKQVRINLEILIRSINDKERFEALIKKLIVEPTWNPATSTTGSKSEEEQRKEKNTWVNTQYTQLSEKHKLPLPRFISWDPPNVILAIALILLLALPCLALTVYYNSNWELLHFAPVALVVPIALVFLTKWPKCALGATVSVTLLSWFLCYFYPNSTPIQPAEDICHLRFSGFGNGVGPFVEGKAELETDNTLGSLANWFTTVVPAKCGEPSAIFVIGSTDRRFLKAKGNIVYGGNEGLARDRAEYVIQHLRTLPALEKVEFVPLFTGSSWHGSEDATDKIERMAKDRSVRVYALWPPKPH